MSTYDRNQIDAIAGLTRQTTDPMQLTPGGYYIVHRGDGDIDGIDLTDHKLHRIEATVRLTDVASLLTYWSKHHDGSSEAYADRAARTVTAVLDDNHGTNTDQADDGERAQWGRHRAILTLETSDQLNAWLINSGKAMSQVAFAEFIEDHLVEIVDPPAADMLEMAQTFQATTSAKFESNFRIHNGQRVLSYVEDIKGSMRDGQTAVPTTLTIAVPIWRGDTEATALTARLRYRIQDHRLVFTYILDRPTEVIDGAFEDVLSQVQEHIGRPVLRGTPAEPR